MKQYNKKKGTHSTGQVNKSTAMMPIGLWRGRDYWVGIVGEMNDLL